MQGRLKSRAKWGLTIMAGGLLAASNALAVRVTDGRGQALLYPIYSTERLDTLLTVTNHTAATKALSVVIRDCELGAAALTFYAYAQPHDTFRFSLSDLERLNVDEGPGIVIPREDATCTVPRVASGSSALPGATYQPFLLFQVSQFGGDLSSMRSGYVEIIEVGEVDPSVDAANCGLLVGRWTSGGRWAQNSTADMSGPTGGLSGRAWLIDVAAGESYVYQATALDDFRSDPLRGNVGQTPSLFDAGQSTRAIVRENGESREVVFANVYSAVSAALTSSSLAAPIVVDERLAARTDLAVTLPSFFRGAIEPIAAGSTPRAPFVRTAARAFVDYEIVDQDGANAGGCASLTGDQLPSSRRMVLDRALTIIPLGGAPNESITGAEALPLLWNDESTRAYSDVAAGRDGEFVLSANPAAQPACREHQSVADDHGMRGRSGNDPRVLGLPIMVTALTRIRNGTLEGGSVLANYGGAHPASTKTLVSSP